MNLKERMNEVEQRLAVLDSNPTRNTNARFLEKVSLRIELDHLEALIASERERLATVRHIADGLLKLVESR